MENLSRQVRFADGNAANYFTCNLPVTGTASVVAGYVWNVGSGFTGGKPPVVPGNCRRRYANAARCTGILMADRMALIR